MCSCVLLQEDVVLMYKPSTGIAFVVLPCLIYPCCEVGFVFVPGHVKTAGLAGFVLTIARQRQERHGYCLFDVIGNHL